MTEQNEQSKPQVAAAKPAPAARPAAAPAAPAKPAENEIKPRVLVPGGGILRKEAVGLDGDTAVRKSEHGTGAGQVDPLAQVEAAVAVKAVGQCRKLVLRHLCLPGQLHQLRIQVAVDALGLPLAHAPGQEFAGSYPWPPRRASQRTRRRRPS